MNIPILSLKQKIIYVNMACAPSSFNILVCDASPGIQKLLFNINPHKANDPTLLGT